MGGGLGKVIAWGRVVRCSNVGGGCDCAICVCAPDNDVFSNIVFPEGSSSPLNFSSEHRSMI